MDDKQLQYFKALYENKNISKTAEELYLTRQALSLSIRRLEQEVGAALFRRTQNGMVPTDAARILMEYVDRQQALWEKTLRQIRKADPERTLRLAIHVMYYTSADIRRLTTYWQEPGGCHFQIVNVTDSGKCQTLLEEGAVDIAYTHKPPHTSRLFWRKLYEAEAWLLMREDDPLAAKELIDFTSDLAGQHLIFPSRETMQEVAPILVEQGATCSHIESDRVLLWQSIDTGGTQFIIPDYSLSNFLREGLTARKLTHFPVVNGRYLIWKDDDLDIDSMIPLFEEL